LKKLHLICNAHIDPIWLWEWEEGASTALSTFRSAADLADEYDYIFCHNEVTLYKWVQEYEPELFERIKKLVKQKKWHIMGGWYLQPDCNMLSGESFVRQAMVGRKYFKEHFDVEPTAAINLDPFGHTIGLVQILNKCGYDSYMITRPHDGEIDLPDDVFIWKGLDGSTVKCARVDIGYSSDLGKAVEKIELSIKVQKDKDIGVSLWGVGNHGGGPSRKDLKEIKELYSKSNIEIIHSTPEAFFKDLNNISDVFERSLNFTLVGCFTSMVDIKQNHRKLENEVFLTEKMLSNASINGLIDYPHDEINEAIIDLLNAQFHDILPGSCIREGEKNGITILDHGLNIVNKLRAKAFFALTSGQEKAKEGEYPILVFNPHPYDIRTTVECEFQLERQNWEDDYTTVEVYAGDEKIKSQVIKESSNLFLDWRKKVEFDCVLKASTMNRFSCKVKRVPNWPALPIMDNSKNYSFDNGKMQVVINTTTGLMDSYKVDGVEYIKENAFCPTICEDNEDSWGSCEHQLITMAKKVDFFKLMDEKSGSEFSGIMDRVIPSVRIIEDGEVVQVVESLLSYNHSFVRLVYKMYHHTTDIDVNVDVFWNEKNKMLKLCIPTTIKDNFIGQVAFGQDLLPQNGVEVSALKWTAMTNKTNAIALINDCVYGFSCNDGEISASLVRGAAYSSLKIRDRRLTKNDRFIPRMDQGEKNYCFRLTAGNIKGLFEDLEFKSQLFNEKPYALNVFPSGKGEKLESLVNISNRRIIMVAFKQSENGDFILRLHNNSAENCETDLIIGNFGIHKNLSFHKYEVKTFRVSATSFEECNLMEI
jgi:alpha-mannosidase